MRRVQSRDQVGHVTVHQEQAPLCCNKFELQLNSRELYSLLSIAPVHLYTLVH